MPKKVYCAECGKELSFMLKALPKQQLTITVVEPHKCSKDTAKNPYKDNNNELIPKDKSAKDKKGLNDAFATFKFNKDLEGTDPDLETDTTVFADPGDLRPTEDIVDNAAPAGILGAVKG